MYQSEWLTSHRNRALAHYLKETNLFRIGSRGSFRGLPHAMFHRVTTEDIALLRLILAQDGYHPVRKEQVIPKKLAKLAKALMLTVVCTMLLGNLLLLWGCRPKAEYLGGIMALVPPSSRSGMPFQDGCGIGIYGLVHR